MPNQPNPTKRILACYMPRKRYYQVKRHCEKCGISMSSFLAKLIEREVRNVELLPEDYEAIAQEIREAQSGNKTDKRRSEYRNRSKGEKIAL